jgi:hypothetical protein
LGIGGAGNKEAKRKVQSYDSSGCVAGINFRNVKNPMLAPEYQYASVQMRSKIRNTEIPYSRKTSCKLGKIEALG